MFIITFLCKIYVFWKRCLALRTIYFEICILWSWNFGNPWGFTNTSSNPNIKVSERYLMLYFIMVYKRAEVGHPVSVIIAHKLLIYLYHIAFYGNRFCSQYIIINDMMQNTTLRYIDMFLVWFVRFRSWQTYRDNTQTDTPAFMYRVVRCSTSFLHNVPQSKNYTPFCSII